MRRRLEVPLKMSIAAIIKSVAPAGAATKWTEAQLNCTPRQAKRIVSEGRVANRFHDAIVEMLKAELQHRRAQLDDVESQLREISYARMVSRAEARRTAGVDPAATAGARQDEGAESSLPMSFGEAANSNEAAE